MPACTHADHGGPLTQWGGGTGKEITIAVRFDEGGTYKRETEGVVGAFQKEFVTVTDRECNSVNKWGMPG